MLPREPLALGLEPDEMGAQGDHLVRLAVEHRTDLLEPEPQLAEQQDALQSHEGVVVYEVVVGQLVTFQAVGGWGTSATMVLVPEAWPYEE